MDSQQSIFVVLGAFFLYESLLWLPRGAVALARNWRGRFRLRHPGRLLGNDFGSIVARALAPPGRRLFVASASQITLSPEGIVRECPESTAPDEPPRRAGEGLAWPAVESISADRRWIRVNRHKWWKTPSEQNAKDLAGRLESIRSAPPEERESRIRKWLASGFNVADAKAVMADMETPLRRLEILGNILFVFLFVALLPLSFFYSFQHLWGWIAGLTLLQTIPISLIYRRTHTRLYPDADDERFTAWLTMLLFAPSAIRAHDGITLPALHRFHPLAAAMATLNEGDARNYAAFLLRESRFAPPNQGSDDNLRDRIARWHRMESVRGLEECCESAGWKIEELLGDPEKSDPESRTYCPRCTAEFVLEEGVCSDCGDVPLRMFDADAMK